MKVILEKEDLLKILSKEFGYELADDDVVVNPDPFEVQVSKLPVQQLAKKAEPVRVDVVEEEDVTDAPDISEQDDHTTTTMTMDQLLAHSDELASGRKASGFRSDSQPIERPLGPDEYIDPPPVSPAEISGGLEALNRLAGGNR